MFFQPGCPRADEYMLATGTLIYSQQPDNATHQASNTRLPGLSSCYCRPTRTIAQLPFTLAQSRFLDRRQQLVVERLKVRVNRFVRAARQENRWPDPSPFELALVQEFRSRQRHDRHCGHTFYFRRERCRRTRFVMVLDETHQLVLVIETSGKVQSNAFRVVVFEPIVEPLVIAIVESELLQIPLQVPIGFRHKKHTGMLQPHGGDHLTPVLFWRGSGPPPPPPLPPKVGLAQKNPIPHPHPPLLSALK